MYRHASLVSFQNARCVFFGIFFLQTCIQASMRNSAKMSRYSIWGEKERNIINVYLILWRSICFTSIEGKCGTLCFRYCRFDPQMIENVSLLWLKAIPLNSNHTIHFAKFPNVTLLLFKWPYHCWILSHTSTIEGCDMETVTIQYFVSFYNISIKIRKCELITSFSDIFRFI